ncbi:MAG: winged helix-turn-helix domain-containing protein [Phycisphaerales bacterium]
MQNNRGSQTGPADGPRTDVRDPVTINALADPTRYAILNAIARGGARTVREVAERLGRRAGSLYRHFDVLEGLGLIARVGTIGTARRDARVYEADPHMRFIYDASDPELVDAINSLVSSAARNASRSFARSARSGATTRGPGRDTHMATQSGWLTDDELRDFNAMVDELQAFLLSCERRPGTRLIETTTIVAPGAVRATPTEDER